ncbi:MAG TPA: winged helix-turn-helix domain-containing protein [Rudaea sp.]|jgi:DNA-binding winged helix-turn-helix (wHTH) protein/Tfp pilus assembly protein PilF
MSGQVLESDRHLNSMLDTPKSAVRGWRAGDLVIDLELRRVRLGGERVVLQETPFRLLCLLLEREGRPVSRRDMHHALWPRYDWDSFERNLNTAVRKLRRAIGDDAREPRLVETLRASGYRWIGPAPRELMVAPSIEIPARLAGDRQKVPATILDNRRKRRTVIGGVCVVALAVVLLALLWPARSAQPWLVVDSADAVGGTIAGSAEARSIAGLLHGAIEGDAANKGVAVHVALSIRNGAVTAANVTDLGGAEKIAIADAPFGRERLLAALAERLPAPALKPANALLPEAAQRAYSEAGTLLGGAGGVESVERAIGLLESTLSAAPSHSGALRAYAGAQRTLAVLARDPVAARDRRLAARAALRRAVVADPRSAAVAADVAHHLFWAEWNAAQAADWYALARREAPQDADILRDYAWFALADDRIGEAMAAMNAALAIAPLSVPLHSDLGWFQFRTGHYDDALRQCRIALEMSAHDNSAQVCEERALAELGRFGDAWQALRRHTPEWLDAASAREFATLGPEAAYRAAMHLAAQKTRERIGAGFDSAEFEAIAGDRAAAEADLAAASALGDPSLHMAPVTPELVHLLGESEARRLARDDAGRRVAVTPTN